jgi:hypothetical protein
MRELYIGFTTCGNGEKDGPTPPAHVRQVVDSQGLSGLTGAAELPSHGRRNALRINNLDRAGVTAGAKVGRLTQR